MLVSLIYATVAGVLVLWLCINYIRRDLLGMRPKDYPPGPPALPILGNLHLIKPMDLHLQFQAFAKKYGPIFSLKLGSQTLVVLSSPQTVKDLLDKRSHIYSARQDFFIRETGDDLNILMRSNDSVWRGLRKMYHLRLNATVADRYIIYQDFESRQLLRDILETPEVYRESIVRFATSLGSTIAYGWRTTSLGLPAVKTMFEWIERYGAVAGQAQLMDWFPVLRPLFRRLPAKLFKIQDELSRINKIEDTLWISQLEGVKTSIKEGKLSESFCRDLLIHNKEGKERDSEREIAYACGHAWSGATDTTGNTIQGFLKAMLLFPKVQHEAQKELDEVVGAGRLPDWRDRDSLPYIRCVQKELLRWFPTALFGGMPHCVTKDDFYMGYKIPAGAGVMNMAYTINNDPERIPNPRNFDPTRYAGDNTTAQESAVLTDGNKRDHHTFGAGRRICPGLHVAERSLFIAISRLLWAFEITPYINSAGKPELPELEAVSQSFVVHPVPFKCTIRPRGGEARAQKIRQSWSEVEDFIDQTGAYNDEFFKTFARSSE